MGFASTGRAIGLIFTQEGFMKKYFVQGFAIPTLFVLSTILNLSVVYAIPIVSVNPSATTVNSGDSFSLDIGVSNVTDLFAYQFELSFDPALIAATSLSEGTFLPGGGFTFFIPGAIDNALGNVGLTADTLFFAPTGVTGSGSLANLTFNALAGGTSSVSLSNVILLDSFGSVITSNILNGSVDVTTAPAPVPEPSTIVLLGIGLLGIGIVRKRSKTQESN